jgi:HAD superfamily hydrolase (TIGR01549 family)
MILQSEGMSSMTILKVGPPGFDPAVIIFDKDGTLIDFDAMWGAWIIALADRLEAVARLPARAALFAALGFDSARGRVLAEGKLAVTPMASLYALTIEMMRERGLTLEKAEAAVSQAWRAPDPVALARPLAHLPTLFTALRRGGIKIAVATTDDRLPTMLTLAGLGVVEWIDAMVCADDGLPVKPAPDMVRAICEALNVPAARSVVVGDSVADMQMGRRAGAGLTVGVRSGVSEAAALSPHADVVIDSIAGLV